MNSFFYFRPAKPIFCKESVSPDSVAQKYLYDIIL